ncbi:SnoaL-like domain-containing protein [Phycicoccus sp. HDW14]|uniref:ester cyclase n=1 Tax=Phycicoccus sp. HDW14 TaxID=2714941 RepID=UPI00140CE3B1|nr:ester cyclase [Phycicoccus sp. HDW14]QIM19994.1 SnoaL-like domain-containing protein [Phycicoccus sp. HDW14]
MTGLEAVYRDYLTALDERRFDELGQFVHDELTYNERPMTRAEYAAMIADDARRIPDLRFHARLVVVSGDVLACRLWFACTPEREFAGVAPTGVPVSFAEHVFYRFRERRIEKVWSLVDLDSFRAQAAGRTEP